MEICKNNYNCILMVTLIELDCSMYLKWLSSNKVISLLNYFIEIKNNKVLLKVLSIKYEDVAFIKGFLLLVVEKWCFSV